MKSTKSVRGEVWVWVVVVILVMCGMVVTAVDYLAWRHAETDKFGQGWGDLDQPALPLPVTYRLISPEIRIKLPQGWILEEKSGTVKTENEFKEAAVIGKYMRIMTATLTGNLVDLVDVRSAELLAQGGLMKDRAYVGGNKLDMTVLEWTEELSGGRLVVKQEAWGKWGDEVIKIETSVDESEWSDLKKTVWAIYENVEMIY